MTVIFHVQTSSVYAKMACDYLSMLGLKINRISEKGPAYWDGDI